MRPSDKQYKAVKFTYSNGRSIELTGKNKKNSREGCCVVFEGRWALKIFSNADSQPRIQGTYDWAYNQELPMPEYSFEPGRVTCSKGSVRNGFALVATSLKHYRYPFAFDNKKTGPSDQSRFTKAIKAIKAIEDVAILDRIIFGLEKAESVGLTDPQGFLDPRCCDHPIMFIDIHTSNSASLSITKMLNVVKAQRAKLSHY